MINEDNKQLIISEVGELYRQAGGVVPTVLFANGPIDALLLSHILSYIQEEDFPFYFNVIYQMTQKWDLWTDSFKKEDIREFGRICFGIDMSHGPSEFKIEASYLKDLAIKRWVELVEQPQYKSLIPLINFSRLHTNSSLYLFLTKGVVGPDLKDSLDGLFEYTVLAHFLHDYLEGEERYIVSPLVEHVYAVSIRKNYCIVCWNPIEGPMKENRTRWRRRYHCATGPAVKFADGYEQYFLYGSEVSKEWVMNPQSITLKDIFSQQEDSIKDELIEFLGGNRFADLFDLVLIDWDEYNHQKILLYRTTDKIKQIEDYIYFVKVICNSTQREYTICVSPSESLSAMGALAWTFGMTPETYLLDAET